MERGNHVATSPPPARVLQVLIAGTNLWFVSTAYPWFFIEQPTPVQSAIHALPLAILLLGGVLLAKERIRLRIGGYLRAGLTVGVPLSVGVAVVARSEAVNLVAMPGWVMLLCVVSLWVFVGALGLADNEPVPAVPSPFLRTTAPRGNLRATQGLAIAAALAIVTLAPRWLDQAEQQAAWGDAVSAGSMLTAASAIAIGLGVLLIVLGPASLTKQVPVAGPLRQRLWPSLALAALSAVAYVITNND